MLNTGRCLYTCMNRCAQYGALPPNCEPVERLGEWCEEPVCEFQTEIGTSIGHRGLRGPDDTCEDKADSGPIFYLDFCSINGNLTYALQNCRKRYKMCGHPIPGTPVDVCVYRGKTYKQDEAWHGGCERVCVCDSAGSGLVRCADQCPGFLNLPLVTQRMQFVDSG